MATQTNYFEVIVAAAQSNDNPFLSKKKVRAFVLPFFLMQNVPFVEDAFGKAYTQFRQASASRMVYGRA